MVKEIHVLASAIGSMKGKFFGFEYIYYFDPCTNHIVYPKYVESHWVNSLQMLGPKISLSMFILTDIYYTCPIIFLQ